MQEISKSKGVFPIFDPQNWKNIRSNQQSKDEGKEGSDLTGKKNGPKNKKNSRKNYSTGPEAKKMKDALDFYKNNPGRNYNEISSKFGVDRRALRERVEGNREIEAKVGKKTFLSHQEEQSLVTHLLELASIGFGYDAVQIRILVRTLLKKDESEVTSSWFRGFMERHPDLSRRRAQALEKQKLLNGDD